MPDLKTFTPEELIQYDGQEGRPIYLAVNGKVYDATGSRLWKNGKHMQRHKAGGDMSREIAEAPHDASVLERLPLIGTVAAHAAHDDEPTMPALLRRIPFLQRHPHPMTVHFPIVLPMCAAVFTLFHAIFGWQGFDQTALCLLGAAVLMTPVAIATGLFTWKINYMGKMLKQVAVKLILSPILLADLIATFLWRLQAPESAAQSPLYLTLVLALIPITIVIGWNGANLTFPIHHE